MFFSAPRCAYITRIWKQSGTKKWFHRDAKIHLKIENITLVLIGGSKIFSRTGSI